jgi:ABC-type polysaccharide/polyol phosphate transport system ATPase subunit
MLSIEVRDVHKSFRIPHEKLTTLTERVLSMFRPVSYERLEALRGVNLEIERGSFVGIIGGNGSGKSTLLKLISGLLFPDAGMVRVEGTMSALLELGLGFSPELTVRENVELYAAVLGFPRHEVRRRVEEAIEFADLERFRDAKLKNLSTGMRARLGFATALQAESDIMLLDEILAVGDADFQLKCLDVFEDFKQRRKTMVLVTHDLSQVQRFCDEAVLLADGKIALRGDPDFVTSEYLKSVGQLPIGISPQQEERERLGDGRIRVLRGWLEDERGNQIGRIRSGNRPCVVVRYRVMEDTDHPVIGIAIGGEDGSTVYSINTGWLNRKTEHMAAGRVVEMRIPFVAALPNGRYTVRAGVLDRDMTKFHDVIENTFRFVVHGSPCRNGSTDLQGEISYQVLSGDAEEEKSTRPVVAGEMETNPRTQKVGGLK